MVATFLPPLAAIVWHQGALRIPGPAVPGPPVGYTVEPTWPLQLLHPVVLLWLVALVREAPRSRRAWGISAVALALRAAVSPWLLMYANGPYLWDLEATGTGGSTYPYGPTWSAVLGPLWLLTGGAVDLVVGVNLAASALTVPFAWAAVRRWTDDEGAADLTALGLAVLPLPVLFARSEVPQVLAVLLAVLALAGAASPRRTGAVLAGASTALLALLRPELLAPALVLVAALAWRRRWTAAFLAGAIVLGRAFVVVRSWLDGTLQNADYTHLRLEVLTPSVLLGPGGRIALSDPALVPVGLALLVPLVVRAPSRARPLVAVLLALLLTATAPFVVLARPFDVARFALPAITWWIGLAAIGASTLAARGRALAVALVAASVAAAGLPDVRGALWSREYQVLRALEGTIPPTATVWFDPQWDENRHFERWVNLRRHGWWRPWDGVPAPGDLVWVGRADARRPEPRAICLEDVDVRPIDGPVWTGEAPPLRPVVAGLRRVCAAPR